MQRVTDLMAEIAAASREQSAGIEQVNTTVMQLDATTQQNAGLAEEMAASAHVLEQKASELLQSVLSSATGNTAGAHRGAGLAAVA